MNSGREKEEERDGTEVKKTKEADTEGGRNGLRRHTEGHGGTAGGTLTVSMCCMSACE